MYFSLRQCIAFFAAGAAWSGAALAQESAPAGGGSAPAASPVFSSGSGSSSSFSVFSSDPPATQTGSTGTTAGDESSGFSTQSFGPSAARTAPPSFTVPGFYGQGSTTFYGGSGRLARPRFRMGVTFGIGYDDNLFSTSSDDTPQIVPGFTTFVDETGQTQTTQQFETKTEVVLVGYKNLGGGLVVPVYDTVTTQEPVEVEDTVIPPDERQGSFFTRTGLSLEMLSYTPRSLFTLNWSGSFNYYTDKPEDPVDYNGSFAMTYLHRLTPRLQMTAQVNTAYLSQPDLTRPNTPQTESSGDLINARARLDLTYRMTPRLSLSATANYDANRYTEVVEQTGDFDEYTFGLEARYLWTPRWTLLLEYRHAITLYMNRDDLDSTTDFLLVGAEFTLSPRLSGALRIGEAIKAFDQSGSSQSAPYVESSVSYRSTARSSVTWTNRFGFEEPQSPNQERLVYRGSINYRYMFSPHMNGNLGVNMVHELTTTEGTDAESTVDTFEAILGLDYEVTRNFSLSGSYTYTLSNTNTDTGGYYRNRLFLGGQYNF